MIDLHPFLPLTKEKESLGDHDEIYLIKSPYLYQLHSKTWIQDK